MAHVPRIYTSGPLQPGPLTLDSESAKHLATVMRVREGDSLFLFNGDGREWTADVASVAKGAVRVNVATILRTEPAPRVRIQLVAGLIRPQRFELLIEKCTEAGVDVIRPMTSEHSGRGEAPSATRTTRWERIAIEAAQQSARTRVPVIAESTSFEAVINARRPFVIADAGGMTLADIVPLLPAEGELTVICGPEGGLSETELARGRQAGALFLRLGPHILRTETAAIAACVLLRQALP